MEVKNKLDSNGIWLLDYKKVRLEQKLAKLFLKHNLKYPRQGFYENWSTGKVLHPNSSCLIFLNTNLKSNLYFLKDIKKVGIIRNFSSGFEIIKISISKHFKIFKIFDFDPNTIENRECKTTHLNYDSIYFFKQGDLGFFILPLSYMNYFNHLIGHFSNNLNLLSDDIVELENYFNFK